MTDPELSRWAERLDSATRAWQAGIEPVVTPHAVVRLRWRARPGAVARAAANAWARKMGRPQPYE